MSKILRLESSNAGFEQKPVLLLSLQVSFFMLCFPAIEDFKPKLDGTWKDRILIGAEDWNSFFDKHPLMLRSRDAVKGCSHQGEIISSLSSPCCAESTNGLSGGPSHLKVNAAAESCIGWSSKVNSAWRELDSLCKLVFVRVTNTYLS